MKQIFSIISFILVFSIGSAQVHKPVKWTFSSKLISATEAQLLFSAKISKGWHLYSHDLPEDGPIPTKFVFEESPDYELSGKMFTSVKPKVHYDDMFKLTIKEFENSVTFIQKITLKTTLPINIKGYVEYAPCFEGGCAPPEEENFLISIDNSKLSETTNTEVVAENKSNNDTSKIDSSLLTPASNGFSISPSGLPLNTDQLTSTIPTKENKEHQSFLLYFFIAMLAGFGGILTPCVYPMIPMTINFFMQKSSNRRKTIIKALIFGISIIILYTIPGLLVGLTNMSSNFANEISTNTYLNLIFFLVFLVFGASFLGMFEITLPAWLINSADKQADKGSYISSFFMAFVLVIVSFSCTGPIVGAILVEAAGEGGIKPIIGMFGFGLAFSIPFTLLAFFPSWLSQLPKSGGWLNAIKIFFGFVILALGLKFFSIADQVNHWEILTRPVFISIWIAIFFILGLYLLGKIKFLYDSEVTHLSALRIMLAIIVFSFTIYLLPGLWGAKLKAVSAFLPPASPNDFSFATLPSPEVTKSKLCDIPKYSEKLNLPHGLSGYFDYQQALSCAKKLNKPLFLDFTGHACTNCKKMEAEVWANTQVLNRMQNNFIITALYVDDKTELPESEWYTSKVDGKIKKTIGKKWADFRIEKFQTNTQPFYVLLDTNEQILTTPMFYNLDVNEFIKFLDKGFEEFTKRQKINSTTNK